MKTITKKNIRRLKKRKNKQGNQYDSLCWKQVKPPYF